MDDLELAYETEREEELRAIGRMERKDRKPKFVGPLIPYWILNGRNEDESAAFLRANVPF